jgi:catechol 2,3-dioxygenase
MSGPAWSKASANACITCRSAATPTTCPICKERAEANGAELVEAPAGFDNSGFWLRDPAGLLVGSRSPKSSPARKTTEAGRRAEAWPARRCGQYASRAAAPCHVLVFTTDIDEAIDFYTGNLGLRLSDRSDLVAFLHGIHGSDQHILAFAQSTAPGMHHCSWDMSSIDDIGLGAMSMAGKGHVKGWGLGRHVLGSNYFHYVQDPWGSFAEYSCDIDYIPAARPWNAKYHEPEDSFYLWGPEPPTDFTINREA